MPLLVTQRLPSRADSTCTQAAKQRLGAGQPGTASGFPQTPAAGHVDNQGLVEQYRVQPNTKVALWGCSGIMAEPRNGVMNSTSTLKVLQSSKAFCLDLHQIGFMTFSVDKRIHDLKIILMSLLRSQRRGRRTIRSSLPNALCRSERHPPRCSAAGRRAGWCSAAAALVVGPRRRAPPTTACACGGTARRRSPRCAASSRAPSAL
jgi:hypothetical protein